MLLASLQCSQCGLNESTVIVDPDSRRVSSFESIRVEMRMEYLSDFADPIWCIEHREEPGKNDRISLIRLRTVCSRNGAGLDGKFLKDQSARIRQYRVDQRRQGLPTYSRWPLQPEPSQPRPFWFRCHPPALSPWHPPHSPCGVAHHSGLVHSCHH